MALRSKTIRILHAGPILALGGIYGPILNWYRERMDVIWSMVRDGLRVVEKCPDGSEVVLTIQNYDQELGSAPYDDEDKVRIPQANMSQPPQVNPPSEGKTPVRYGFYRKIDWETMYDESTRRSYLYHPSSKWNIGMKCVYTSHVDSNFMQVYIRATDGAGTDPFNLDDWRIPENEEEARLDYFHGDVPHSIQSQGIYEYDSLNKYNAGEKVALFNTKTGKWAIYEATTTTETNSLNTTKEGWKFIKWVDATTGDDVEDPAPVGGNTGKGKKKK